MLPLRPAVDGSSAVHTLGMRRSWRRLASLFAMQLSVAQPQRVVLIFATAFVLALGLVASPLTAGGADAKTGRQEAVRHQPACRESLNRRPVDEQGHRRNIRSW